MIPVAVDFWNSLSFAMLRKLNYLFLWNIQIMKETTKVIPVFFNVCSNNLGGRQKRIWQTVP
ncbi:MAG: hypothetical protein COA98_07545 [Candidatus Neomarinimicrobiota bacterium]|nr:MAG: hypothetical protein COA98_07545 [Candidatus Neomarinimicrobiota bacterium]